MPHYSLTRVLCRVLTMQKVIYALFETKLLIPQCVNASYHASRKNFLTSTIVHI